MQKPKPDLVEEGAQLESTQPVLFKYHNISVCLEVTDADNSGNALQDFDVVTTCYQSYGSSRTLRKYIKNNEKDCVAFKITLTRTLRPFLMKYYLPSIAIVISSQISFVIPIQSLPARTALVATMFLSLISLFISQQVCKND